MTSPLAVAPAVVDRDDGRVVIRCGGCGYGAVVARPPVRCPMCGRAAWRPAVGYELGAR